MRRLIFCALLVPLLIIFQPVISQVQNTNISSDTEGNTAKAFDTLSVKTHYPDTIHADFVQTDAKNTRLSDITTQDKKEKKSIPYKKILDKEFTRVTTGNLTNYGSYASYDVTDNAAVFAGQIGICEKSNLQFEAKGVINQGIMQVSHAGNVSPNFSARVQFNNRIYEDGIRYISDATADLNYINSLDSLDRSEEERKFELKILEQKLRLEKEQKVELQKRIKKEAALILQKEKDSIQRSIKIDSLNLKDQIVGFQIYQLDGRIRKLEDKNEIARQEQNIEEEIFQAKQKLEKNLQLTNYDLKWWSYYMGLNSRKFYSFRDSLDISEQLLKQSFTSFEIGARYNIYKIPEAKSNPNFYSIGFSFLSHDNYEDLDEQSLTDKQEYAADSINRSTSRNQKVYVGTYEKNLLRFKVDGDIYLFVTANPSVAIHINPNIIWNLNQDLRCNLILGCFISFRNKKDSKSIINAELFYQSFDFLITSEVADNSFINNSGFGLRFTFPIVLTKK